MMKLFFGALGAVFVSTLVVEIMRHKSARASERLKNKARRAVNHAGIRPECRKELCDESEQ